jgi:hypothetical protein
MAAKLGLASGYVLLSGEEKQVAISLKKLAVFLILKKMMCLYRFP